MPLALFLPFQPFEIGFIRFFITDHFRCNVKGSRADNLINLDADRPPVPFRERLSHLNLRCLPFQQFG